MGHAMRAATNRSVELTEAKLNDGVDRRLWLRNHYDPYGLSEQLAITDDARAEIMRRAIEAEQTADYREGVNMRTIKIILEVDPDDLDWVVSDTVGDGLYEHDLHPCTYNGKPIEFADDDELCDYLEFLWGDQIICLTT